MACNDDASHLSTSSSGCYPTGCPPCSEAINFPDDPKDGQRFCVPVGSDGETKCWVYDLCVPAWRAEGPATSPTRYRGGVDIKTQKPGWEDTTNEIKAGDWYIQTKDESAPYQVEWGLSLSNTILSGTRLAYNGVSWQELEPANIPYAEEARDATPDPEDRGGGIVKLASVEEVEAGTNKCNPVTPYTLKEGIEGLLDVEFKPNTCETEASETGPEQVAYFSKDENDSNILGCKTLSEGSTNFKGVGRVASAFTNNTNTPGYSTDWLTNASMAPIIDALILRIEELENGSNGGTGSGMTPIAQVNQVFEIQEDGTNEFTWSPIDSANLQQIAIVLAGGAGGSAIQELGQSPGDAIFQGTRECPAYGGDSRFYRMFITGNANVPTGGIITIGQGGLGGLLDFCRIGKGRRCPQRGQSTVANMTGGAGNFQALVGGGDAAIQPPIPDRQPSIECGGGDLICEPNQQGEQNSANMIEDVTAAFPRRQANRRYEYGPSFFDWRWMDAGQSVGGMAVIYEYYPTDWVDPRGTVRVL